jgi:hypothetical protein
MCHGSDCSSPPAEQLSQSTRKEVDELLRLIPPKAEHDQIEQNFGWKAHQVSPELIKKYGGLEYRFFRTTWLLTKDGQNTFDPHVDVYFVNGKAYELKAWPNGLQRMIQLTYAD